MTSHHLNAPANHGHAPGPRRTKPSTKNGPASPYPTPPPAHTAPPTYTATPEDIPALLQKLTEDIAIIRAQQTELHPLLLFVLKYTAIAITASLAATAIAFLAWLAF